MARKPYVPLNQQPECEAVSNNEHCDSRDRNVRAMVSADPNNSIQQRSDGLFAPAVVYRENTSVTSGDAGIDVTEGTSDEGYRRFTVGTVLSTANGNILQLNSDGLFVPSSETDPENNDPVLLHEGSLIYSPLTPGQGRITYTNRRNAIRITNGLTRILLTQATAFEEMEEVYLVQDVQRLMPFHLMWEAGVTVDNVAGPGSRTFAPGRSVHILRHSGQNWLVLGGDGVDEAPFDDSPYTRRNGVWVQQHAQVLAAQVLGEPADVQPLDVTTSQFNRIVHIHERFEELVLRRQHVANYQDNFEATYIKDTNFLLNVPMGVRVNGFDGPIGFNVERKPKGCVLKKVSTDNWLLLGSVQQDGSVTPLPPITTLELPGSGNFRGVVRLMDGTILYDMTGNNTMFSSVNSIKNLIIAALVVEDQAAYLDMKDQVYQASYRNGLSTNLSDLQDGDIVSYRDLITLVLHGSYEDVCVMLSDKIGLGDHAAFTAKMNAFVAAIETPLVSSFFGAAITIANPVGVSNTYKVADWVQYIEENYSDLLTLMRQTERVFTIFGPNNRAFTSVNQNPYLTTPRVDYGKVNDLTNASHPLWGFVSKLEMPSDIPVYLSMHQFTSELERHWGVTSALMAIEDDFPFLTGSVTDYDTMFSNVSLLLGNSVSLIDRSNISNQVFNSPTGFTAEVRDTKGWIRSYLLDGTSGYITIYDNNSFRLGNSNFTIELIIRGAGIKTNMIIFAKDGFDLADQSYMLRIVDQNFVFTYTLVGDTEPREWVIPLGSALKNVLFSGARRHITLQRSGRNLGLFINGRLLGSLHELPEDAVFQDCGMPLNIGCNGDPTWNPAPTSGWNGQFRLDNMRMTKGFTRYPMTGFPVRTTPFKNGSGS